MASCFGTERAAGHLKMSVTCSRRGSRLLYILGQRVASSVSNQPRTFTSWAYRQSQRRTPKMSSLSPVLRELSIKTLRLTSVSSYHPVGLSQTSGVPPARMTAPNSTLTDCSPVGFLVVGASVEAIFTASRPLA